MKDEPAVDPGGRANAHARAAGVVPICHCDPYSIGPAPQSVSVRADNIGKRVAKFKENRGCCALCKSLRIARLARHFLPPVPRCAQAGCNQPIERTVFVQHVESLLRHAARAGNALRQFTR